MCGTRVAHQEKSSANYCVNCCGSLKSGGYGPSLVSPVNIRLRGNRRATAPGALGKRRSCGTVFAKGAHKHNSSSVQGGEVPP